MATTTENYIFNVTLTAPASPFMVGDAIKRAMATMPDDTMDWSFDPMQGAEESVSLDLVAYDGEDSVEIGYLRITPSASVERV